MTVYHFLSFYCMQSNSSIRLLTKMPVYYVVPCITWYIMFCFRGSRFQLYGADGNASGVITIIDPQDYIDWIETLQLNIHMINTDNVNTVVAFDFPSSIPCTLFQVSHVYKDKLPYCLRSPPSQVHWCSEIDSVFFAVGYLIQYIYFSQPRSACSCLYPGACNI